MGLTAVKTLRTHRDDDVSVDTHEPMSHTLQDAAPPTG